MSETVEREREYRLSIWESLHERGGPKGIDSSLLKELRIAVGQQGIWADKSRTAPLTDSGTGVTFSIRHTGKVYADEYFDDGLIYHYPQTDRKGSHDENEIAATKEAARLSLPIFVIATPSDNPKVRDVHLGWVLDADDYGRIFLISFDEPQERVEIDLESKPFQLKAVRESKQSVISRKKRTQKFKFSVLKRSGSKCAVCEISCAELLDAAHLCPVEKGGSDDPRNGVILCATHHRAFDADLFAIDPESKGIITAKTESLKSLGLVYDSILHLDYPPHIEALLWRWKSSSLSKD